MIKLLHFADLHLGVELHGKFDPETSLNTRIRDFLRRLDEMVAYAKQGQADLVIFAGDAFKNRQPNPTLQREFALRILDLAAICPVILLVGNHDMPNILERAHSLEIYDVLGVPNVLVGQDYRLYTVETAAGRVQVATAPYPLRNLLLNDPRAQTANMKQLDEMLQSTLTLILRDFAVQAKQHPDPRVLAGHFTVAGATFGTERGAMMGRDVAAALSEIADPAWDYVALGHIHKHQNLTAGMSGFPPVVYSGSLERVDFGEENDDKGFCWVNLERGNTSWKFVKVGARPFVTITADVRGLADPMAKILSSLRQQEVNEAIVRVLITADVETEAKIQDVAIQEALIQAGAQHIAGVQKEVDRPARRRLGASPEGLTQVQLLRHFLRAKGFGEARIEVLIERAQGMIEE